MVSQAVAHSHGGRRVPTGDLLTDLVEQIRDVRGTYERIDHIGMVGVLLTEEKRHPEFLLA